MMNRRDFVRNTTLGVGAGIAMGSFPGSVGASPYGLPIGLQLYTLREQAARDLTGTLQRVAQTGYKQVELFDYYKKSAGEWSKLLADLGLSVPSAHYGTRHIGENWQKEIDYASELGVKYMVIAFLFPQERKSLDDYKRLIDKFNKAGEQTHKAGIGFCYHNHNFEFIPYGGATGWDVLLKQTDPKLVKIEMDCFWVARAGRDPVKYLEDYPGRFPLLHIKDMKPGLAPTTELEAPGNPFAPVGKGVIDYKRIFAAARTGGLEHLYVEQDRCDGSPFDAIATSYEYLKNLTVA